MSLARFESGASCGMAFKSPAFLMEISLEECSEWLASDIGDRETAERMIKTAILIGKKFGYPIPVVTDGKHGKVGVRWDEGLITGYGLSVGSRE